jgi:hypothetical protein
MRYSSDTIPADAYIDPDFTLLNVFSLHYLVTLHHTTTNYQIPLPDLSGLIPMDSHTRDINDAESQVIPLLKSSTPEDVDCYSIYAAQQAISKLVSIKRHPYDLACAVTDFKLQGRTLPTLIISLCKRKRMPWMTLQAFYVLISRVSSMSSIRLLQKDRSALDSVRKQMPDQYLYAWERGYDEHGKWSADLAAVALQNIRNARRMEKMAAATNIGEQQFTDNQRSPNKRRPAVNSSPNKRQTLQTCSTCKLTGHNAQRCRSTSERQSSTSERQLFTPAPQSSPSLPDSAVL